MASSINASTTSGVVTTADNSGILNLQTANTSAITIDGSQNVGIGASPVDKLTVVTTGSAQSKIDSYETVQFRDSNVAYLRVSGGSVDTLLGSETSGGTSFIGTYTNSPVTLRTNNTEKMRIDSSGNLMIGTTSTALPTSGNPNVGYSFYGNGDHLQISKNTSSYGTALLINRGTTCGTGTFIEFWYNGAQCGQIISNGTSAVTYATSSDYRLKENVEPISGALDKVSQLKPCSYSWKEDGKAAHGFIAHELQSVIPDAVFGEKNAVNEDGSIKPQSIDQSYLVSFLTAAIQELSAKVTALEEQVINLGVK